MSVEPTPIDLWIAWQQAERDALEWAERRFCHPYDPVVCKVAEQTADRAERAKARLSDTVQGLYERMCDPDLPDNRAIADAVSARLADLVKERAR